MVRTIPILQWGEDTYQCLDSPKGRLVEDIILKECNTSKLMILLCFNVVRREASVHETSDSEDHEHHRKSMG